MTASLLRGAALCILAGITSWSAPAMAQYNPGSWDDKSGSGWWLGAGLGAASVGAASHGPSAGRGGFAASVDFGYRLTPQWGLGFEYAGVMPAGGCESWNCPAAAVQFSPNFTHLLAFGEYRPRETGWRFRAGLGASRFCSSKQWSDTAFGWGDVLNIFLSAALDQEASSDEIGGYRCDGRMSALTGVASVGYDWSVSAHSPVTMGVRLSAEAAKFAESPAINVPAFRYRAVTLTLHLNIN
jgi:hypothetical protein